MHTFLASTFAPAALAALAALGPVNAALAQSPVAPSSPPLFGIAERGTDVLAAGRAFEASFDRAGVTYVAALGAGAPTEQTLRLEARSLERDCALPTQLAPARPRVDGDRVSYARGGGITEIYDVTADGIAQSFLLEAPLPGSGDLVVRCALGGNLAGYAAALPDGGVEFRGPFGGVRIGAVTGIDADGRRCAGSLRAAEGVLELVLPADFVERAAYPLLIDPLIGTVFTIVNDTWNDTEPDVAYDATNKTYLVVWRRVLSATSSGIHGRRFDASGAVLGNLLTFSASGATGPPKIANVQWSDRFFVVWTQAAPLGENLVGRACDAADGALSNQALITATVGDHIHGYDVAGENHNKAEYTQALVVYRSTSSTPAILCARVAVPPTGTPSATWTTTLVTETPLLTSTDAPTISRSGGALGEFLVAYRSRLIPFGGDWEIAALGVDRSGFATTPVLTVTANSVDELAPRVDGGATLDAQFVIAYEREPISTLRELEVTTVKIASGALVKTGAQVVTSPLVKLSDYDIAWTPGRATLIWAQKNLFGSNYNVSTRDVDATNATLFGAASTPVASVTPAEGGVRLAIASVQSGGVYGQGDGLMAFDYHTGIFTRGDVFGQLFDSLIGGTITSLGGGCGAGGLIVPAGDASIGNGFFQLTLTGADPLAPFTILNLSPPVATIDCGGCAWLPFLAETVYPTLSGGSQVVLQVPNDLSLVGHPIQAQFTTPTLTSSPCPLAPNFSLSNRVEIVMGL